MVDEKKDVYFKELKGEHIDVGSIERLRRANKFFTQDSIVSEEKENLSLLK